MSGGDIAVLVAVGLAIAAAVFFSVRSYIRRGGCSCGCGCGCAGCKKGKKKR